MIKIIKLQVILSEARYGKFDRDELMLKQNDTSDTLYILLSGRVAIFRNQLRAPNFKGTQQLATDGLALSSHEAAYEMLLREIGVELGMVSQGDVVGEEVLLAATDDSLPLDLRPRQLFSVLSMEPGDALLIDGEVP